MFGQFVVEPVREWANLHKKAVLISGLLGLFALALAAAGSVFRVGSSEIARARSAYRAWKENPKDSALLGAFRSEFLKTASAQGGLRCEMAQALLAADLALEADKASAADLARLRKIAPEYADFAETSLLIGQGADQLALERAVSLKEKEEIKLSFPALYGANLIRIAFLQQKLGNSAGEIAAWNDIEASENNRTLAELCLKGSGDQTVNFESYIEKRRKELNPF